MELAPSAMRCGEECGSRTFSTRANVRAETIEIVVNGADGPVLDGTPDFIKSLPLEKALDDNTLIAYEMNGAPIPHYNGFPIRLIVPGRTPPIG